MRRILKRIRNEGGQTIVDVMVAFALLSMALAAAGLVSVTASRAASEAGRRSQAVALGGREMEALRNYRDDVAKIGVPWAGIAPSGGSCRSLIMQYKSPGDYDTHWHLQPAGAPVEYTTADDPSFSDTTTLQYSNFSRLVTLCDDTSSNLLDVEVKVYWTEGTGAPLGTDSSGKPYNRQVTINSVLSNWTQ